MAEQPNFIIDAFAILDQLSMHALAVQAISIAYVSGDLPEGIRDEYEEYVARIVPELAARPGDIGAFYSQLQTKPNQAETLATFIFNYTNLAGSAIRWGATIKFLAVLVSGMADMWRGRDLLLEMIDQYIKVSNKEIDPPEKGFVRNAWIATWATDPYVSLLDIMTARTLTQARQETELISNACAALASLALTDPYTAKKISESVIEWVGLSDE